MSADDRNGRYFVSALARGLQVLEAFSASPHPLSLTEIAVTTGLDKSTTFRLVYTLERLGYLARDPETKLYRLGLRLAQFGRMALGNLDMVQVAQPYLKALSKLCDETTNMSVRDGAEIVYVARNKTLQVLNVGLEIGSRLPVWCTSMGKAQLIDMSPDDLRQLLGEGPYASTGPHALADLDALLADLDRVRAQGYAVNDEELAAGIRSVAAPIRDGSGQIVAAINISVPSVRVSRQELDGHLAPMVQETARQISRALGGGASASDMEARGASFARAPLAEADSAEAHSAGGQTYPDRGNVARP